MPTASTPLRLDEALARLRARFAPEEATPEAAGLEAAAGRVLAETVRAARPAPPGDNAAVDGWAFAHDSLPSGGVLRAVGHAAAGRPFARALGPGEAVRVLTGALMPEGADTVAMEEDCALLGGGTSEAAAEAARAGAEVELRVPEGLGPGANRRRAGEDLQAGAEVLKAGRLLKAADLGLLAAAGRGSVLVRPRLRVALFSCGAELREPGAGGGGEGEGAAGLARERIWDANRPMLRALLAELPVNLQDGGILPDDDRAIEAALARAAEANGLILASGGDVGGRRGFACAAPLSASAG